MSEYKNSDVYLRPRFSLDYKENQEALILKFKENLNSKFSCKIIDNHIIIDVPSDEDHFWSPQLHLEIEESDNQKSIVKGLFGPKSQVWTFFMFLHFMMVIAFISFSIMLYTRWSLERNINFPLIMIVVVTILWIVMYFLGREGKKKGRPQMNDLHNYMKETLSK